ncbi:MAG: nicotinate (nicotinamide) nucleotide adenylyltransferase [Pirellulales bacterium]|nr:nicotinate (nicotinamide) nucleotide adenylyltransferase [Pirellulales bacterium]
MRIGVFGGSFDPPHLGHLSLAASCQEQADLDQVWFVPAAQQPFKPRGPEATDAHRLAMLERACADQTAFKVCDIEIGRGGVSYTVNTLQTVRCDWPQASLFFLMGADSLSDLPRWHRPIEICQLAIPLVVRRAGSDQAGFDILRDLVSSERMAEILQSQVDMPIMPISSSEIREKIPADGEWQQLVPLAVAEYIQQHGLYGCHH